LHEAHHRGMGQLPVDRRSSGLVDVAPGSRPSSQSEINTSTGSAICWDDATVAAIAQRVAGLSSEELCKPLRLTDTPTVARMLGVSEDWVRDHAAELGAFRVGDGPKGALRFDIRQVRASLEHRRLDRTRERQPRRPGPRRRSLGVLPAAVPDDVRDW
jgi:hypothetical protein